MSANNFWNNFSHGFMHGMFNTNPFMCSNMFYPDFSVFGGFNGFGNCFGGFGNYFGNFWNAGCYTSLFTCPTYMNSMTMYPSFMNTSSPISIQPSAPQDAFTLDFNFDDVFKKKEVQLNSNDNNLYKNDEWTPTSSVFEASLEQETSNNTIYDVFEKSDLSSNLSSANKPAAKAVQSNPPKKANKASTHSQNRAKMLQQPVNDKYFDKMLSYILTKEGGYVNDSSDSGGETNKGVIKTTYDKYRKSKGLSTQSVRYITDNELKEIYFNIFKSCGADKIDNPQMAIMVFDTAVNCGPKKAKELFKKSDGNLQKYEKLRRDFYSNLAAKRPKDKKYLKGWNNRVTDTMAFAQTLPNKQLV